jgi:predicted metal-dependent hydrolase
MTERRPARDASAFAQGAELFNAGAYFEAHEVWEDLWRAEPLGARRTALQGLIQAAAALHKVTRQGDRASAARILTRACAKLDAVPADVLAADVHDLPAFHAGLAACLNALQANAELDAARVPVLRVAAV